MLQVGVPEMHMGLSFRVPGLVVRARVGKVVVEGRTRNRDGDDDARDRVVLLTGWWWR